MDEIAQDDERRGMPVNLMTHSHSCHVESLKQNLSTWESCMMSTAGVFHPDSWSFGIWKSEKFGV